MLIRIQVSSPIQSFIFEFSKYIRYTSFMVTEDAFITTGDGIFIASWFFHLSATLGCRKLDIPIKIL